MRRASPARKPRLLHHTSVAVAVFALTAVVAGCGTTQQVKVKDDQSYCPFLGSSLCAKLTATDTPRYARMLWIVEPMIRAAYSPA